MTTIHNVSGANGLSLHVREWGNPNGRPILLIHGWSQSHLCWSKQFTNALCKDHRVVELDIRGHGMSGSPLEVEHYNQTELWANDIKAVIDTLKLNRAILVGWSYGGLIIGDYLRTHGTEAIAGINFVGAAPALSEKVLGSLIGPGFYENFEAATSTDLPTSLPAIVKFLQACFQIPPTANEFHTMIAFNAIVHPTVRENLAARDLDNKDVLQQCDIPVLVSHGKADIVVLPAAADYFLAHCPTATASWYEGVGHAPFFEAADRFNTELAAFVQTAL